MGTKYKVSIGNKIFGNYPGKSAEEAVNKAIKAHKITYNFSYPETFTVTRGPVTTTVVKEG